MNKSEATKIAIKHLASLPISNSEDQYILIDELTLERPYGWVFRYNSKLYVETGNFIYALGGNGPIVVFNDTGELHQLASSMPGEQALKEFESKFNLSV